MRNQIIELIRDTLPMYDRCTEGGHDREHIIDVIQKSVDMAKFYKLNEEIAAVAACFHDIGLVTGDCTRTNHHKNGFDFVEDNRKIFERFFNSNEIELIKHAILEHRSRFKGKPYSIYSMIVSDADRSIDIKTMIKRSYLFNKSNGFDNSLVYDEVYSFLKSKYGDDGYVKFKLPYSMDKLDTARKILANKEEFDKYYYNIIKELEV